MLVIKQALQFLNTLLEFGYYQSVLLFRFSKQVRRTIVILYAIVVMNFPAFWKRFIMRSFPNKNMLQYISALHSSRIVRFINKDIAMSIIMSAAFPRWVFFSPPFFMVTSSAKFRPFTHWLSATGASNLRVLVFVKMRKVIKAGLFLPFGRATIFSRRLVVTLPNTMRTKVHMSTCLTKNSPAITTLNISHLTTNYITTIAKSQVVNS